MRWLPVISGVVLTAALAAQAQVPSFDAYQQGITAFDAHRYADAVPLFAEAEDAAPGQTDALLYEGKALVNLGRYPAADKALQQYFANHPDSSDALYLLGFVLNREDKPRQSLETYTRAARLSTPRSDDLKVVAIDYVMLDDYPDAIRWMREALRFNPKNEQAWYGLGRCYYTQSDFPRAEQAFRRALALNPHDLKAQTNLALTLGMRNEPSKADVAYQAAIRLANANPHTTYWPYLDYGTFLLEQSHAAKAIPILQRAVALGPKCADCYGKLGRALEATGKFDAAVIALQKAVALDPKEPKLHYALGHAYRSAGMAAKSRQEMALTAKLYAAKDSVKPK